VTFPGTVASVIVRAPLSSTSAGTPFASVAATATGSSATVAKFAATGTVPVRPVAVAALNWAVSLPSERPARTGPAPWDASSWQRRRSSSRASDFISVSLPWIAITNVSGMSRFSAPGSCSCPSSSFGLRMRPTRRRPATEKRETARESRPVRYAREPASSTPIWVSFRLERSAPSRRPNVLNNRPDPRAVDMTDPRRDAASSEPVVSRLAELQAPSIPSKSTDHPGSPETSMQMPPSRRSMGRTYAPAGGRSTQRIAASGGRPA
jgi:hypothetical protein